LTLPTWRSLAALLLLLLAACSPTRPNLARLYTDITDDPDQPPVIVIHGLAGATLVDAKTHKQFWPATLGALAFGDFSKLAQMSVEDREGEGLVPGTLMYDVVGVDFYGELLKTLEGVGRFAKGTPGQPVGDQRRRYYVLVYDWRKDNLVAVRKLHALIEQIRRDYDDPKLRVDIIAHSNGGLVTSYYLRYGPRELPAEGPFQPWDEGDKRIRRVVMLGTPALGAVSSLERLMYGTRMGLHMVPVEVMATFATPFQALPHPRTFPILDPQGAVVPIDIYDAAQWRQRHWGVYAPEVIERVRASAAGAEAGERAVAELHATFERNLARGKRMQLALSAPFPAEGVQLVTFGGDCEVTPGHGVLLPDANGGRVVFRPGQVPSRARGRVDYEKLMLEPGDGLVTRSSQTARRPLGAASDDFHVLPVRGSFFLCESHGRLTHNLYFQDNLLYFLLSR
jgi:pimeloyl-ACP methyl ester carboxylesterase